MQTMDNLTPAQALWNQGLHPLPQRDVPDLMIARIMDSIRYGRCHQVVERGVAKIISTAMGWEFPASNEAVLETVNRLLRMGFIVHTFEWHGIAMEFHIRLEVAE